MRGAVEGFEPAMGRVREQLEGVGEALRRGEQEAGRAEDAVRALQREMREEMSQGLQEALEGRGRDLGAQEQALEAGLGELTRSVSDSLAQVTGVQDHAQAQIRDLAARLDGAIDPAPFKEELAAVAAAVAELRAANQRTETSTQSLREEVGSLGAELETTNQTAASVAGEVESVRALVRSTAAALEQAVSGMEGSVQALSAQAVSLRSGLEEAHSGLRSATERLQDAEARGERVGEELGVRLGAAEGTAATLAAGLDSLLSRADSQEGALASLAGDLQSATSTSQSELAAVQAALGEEERARSALAGQVEALRSDLAELQSAADILNSTQAEQGLRESRLTLQLEGLGRRLRALGEVVREAQASNTLKVSAAQERVRQIMTRVDSLLLFSDRVKGHVEAISSLQSALDETNASVSAMSKKHKVSGGNV